MRYSSVCLYVRHPFCPVRFRFSYVAYPLNVRYALVLRPFYLVSTSTYSQRITNLSTDNFYFHPLGVRSSYPVRCDRGLGDQRLVLDAKSVLLLIRKYIVLNLIFYNILFY